MRYNDGTGVEHGWWVRLMLLRDNQAPFILTVRQESLFRRPYTQKERLFQDEVRRIGHSNLEPAGRVLRRGPEVLGRTAILPARGRSAGRRREEGRSTTGRRTDLLKTYHWEGVDQETRAAVSREAERLVKRRLASVSVSPRRFGGRLYHWQGFRIWDPNLPVLGYVVLEFADNAGPKSVSLEFGETRDGARLVNYIVSQDDRPPCRRQSLSGPISVQGFPMVPLRRRMVRIVLPDRGPRRPAGIAAGEPRTLEGPAYAGG